jgi:hypothetical protein
MTKKKQVKQKPVIKIEEPKPIIIHVNAVDEKRIETMHSIAVSLGELIKSLNTPFRFDVNHNSFKEGGLKINILTLDFNNER